jgi:tungstate transport system permease protein
VSCALSCVVAAGQGGVPQGGVPDFLDGLKEGANLILSGNGAVVRTTLNSLHVAIASTAIASAVGIPCGCVLGLGRSRLARVLLTLANAFARFPPVGIGVLVVLMLTDSSPVGGGLLAFLRWDTTPNAIYLAQTLLAVPIVIVLTASAVRGVPAVLLDQARAYGAPAYARATLAVREARRAVVAGVVVAMGITITAIGAIAVAGVPPTLGNGEARTLALGAFVGIKVLAPGTPPSGMDPTAYPSATLAVAYSIVLIGLFVVIAAALTFLQEKDSAWLPGRAA